MLLQTCKYFKPEVNKYGCYFMALIYLASQKTSKSYGSADINNLYEEFVTRGWMKPTCYIIDPGAILRHLGLNVDYEGKREGHGPACRDEYEILCFRRSYTKNGKLHTYKHFVTGDGLGHVAYDPMGMSNAVKHGHLESKRIFLRRD